MRNLYEKIKLFILADNFIYPAYLLVCCLFIWGMPGKGVLYFGDVQASYIFYPEKVYGSIDIWKDLYNSGKLDYGFFQSYFFSLLVIISSFLLNISWHSYLYSFLGYYLFSLSALVLFNKIFKNKFVAFIVAIFFLVSPITYVYNSSILLIYSLAFINFALVNFHNIFYSQEKEKVKWREVVFLGIFLTLANVYFQNFFLLAYIFPLFVLFNLREIFNNKVYLIKNFLAVFVLYLLLNIQWIYILIFQFRNGAEKLIELSLQSASGLDVANLITKLTNIVSIFRNLPYYYKGGDSPLSYYNNNYLLFFVTFFSAIIIFYPIARKNIGRFKRGVIFSLTLFIILLPIINGNKKPFQQIFLFFWNNVPFASSFRTFTKLMFINLYATAYLLGVSIILFTKARRIYKPILILLITLPIIIYNNKLIKSLAFVQYDIPKYYYELNNFKQSLEANTILMPQTNWLVTYKWRQQEKDTDNILPFFYNGRVLTNGASYEHTQEWQNYNDIAASFIVNKYFDKLGNLFSIKNVAYVILQDDINSFLDFKDDTRITIESNIKGSGNFLKKIANFGDIYVYEIPDEYFNQQIFSPREISFIRGAYFGGKLSKYSPLITSEIIGKANSNIDSVVIFQEQNATDFKYPNMQSKEDYIDLKDSILLKYASAEDSAKISSVTKFNAESTGSNDLTKIKIENAQANKSNIEFKKVSSAQYELYIHNAKPDNVPILFSEAYDKGWSLYPSLLSKENEQIRKLKDCSKSKNKCMMKQAKVKEINEYKTDNKLSMVGNEYISREYNGSIQNNNLNKAPLLDIMKSKKIDYSHYYADGYSNLFIINPENICADNKSSCKINKDGTYDLKLTLFFAPQKNFFIFYSIAVLTMISCFGYIIYGSMRKRLMTNSPNANNKYA